MPRLQYHGLTIRTVPIASLIPDSQNARLHSSRNLDAIRQSLQRFGQVEPLVIQKGTMGVIGGNGRLEVMKSLGFTEAQIVEVAIDGPEAKALGISLNRTAESSEWDIDALNTLAADNALDLESLGFTESDMFQFESGESGDATASRTGPAATRAMVKIVIAVEDVGTIERALRAAEIANRGEALVEICREFLSAKGQFDISSEISAPA